MKMVSQTLESKYLSEQIIRERLAQLFPGDSSIHIEVCRVATCWQQCVTQVG